MPWNNLPVILRSEHLEIVRSIARSVRARLPRSVQLDELMSDGNVGLLHAIRRFDPKRGVPFRKYAGKRIRGAICDGLRRRDWVPRSIRAAGSAVPWISSLSQVASDDWMDSRATRSDATICRRESIDALRSLPPRERIALTFYFLEGATMKQTGQIFAMTEAGASLLVKRAITRLAAAATRSELPGRQKRGVGARG